MPLLVYKQGSKEVTVEVWAEDFQPMNKQSVWSRDRVLATHALTDEEAKLPLDELKLRYPPPPYPKHEGPIINIRDHGLPT